MITTIQGMKYNFEIVSQNGGNDFCFFIRAMCKSTKRTSCINNLNTILSEFDVEVDDPKYQDSSWVVTKEEAYSLEARGKQFLSSSSFRDYIEGCLDEDRTLGEWENIAE